LAIKKNCRFGCFYAIILFKMEAIRQFLREVVLQFYQITWPDKETLTRLTVVVLFIAVLSGLLFGGIDFFFTKLVELVALR